MPVGLLLSTAIKSEVKNKHKSIEFCQLCVFHLIPVNPPKSLNRQLFNTKNLDMFEGKH